METKEKRRPAGTAQRPAAQRTGTQRRSAQSGTNGQRRSARPNATGQRTAVNRQSTQRSARTADSGRTGTTGQRRRPSPQRRRPTQATPSPDVVYVQPAPFNRTRFLLCLLVVVAVVLAVVFGMSIFFKVDADKIVVSGTEKYTPWQIREASGIKDGENLLSISEPRISSNIEEALPYVNKVRV